MILSARYVHAPRVARRCGECGRRLGPHIRLYGSAHDTERPHTLRLCAAHCEQSIDEKVRAAVAQAAARAGDVAAEAARLAAWNGATSREQPRPRALPGRRLDRRGRDR